MDLAWVIAAPPARDLDHLRRAVPHRQYARRLFGERGYADVGTEEIVRSAGLTRGALYHHFESKREVAGHFGLGLVRPLAHVLMGALDEAALLAARADDDDATRAEVGATLSRLLDALAADAPGRP